MEGVGALAVAVPVVAAVVAAAEMAVVKTKFSFSDCSKNGGISLLDKKVRNIAEGKEMTPVKPVLLRRENENLTLLTHYQLHLKDAVREAF